MIVAVVSDNLLALDDSDGLNNVILNLSPKHAEKLVTKNDVIRDL